jgi:purine-binding chemotaxis protein CheW
VRGVINFRGRVIPLIDARARLGAPRREPGLSTPIVVVETDELMAGLVVDEVVEVLAVRHEALDPPGHVTAGAPALSGVARHGERLIPVLDHERICEVGAVLHRPSAMEPAHDAAR